MEDFREESDILLLGYYQLDPTVNSRVFAIFLEHKEDDLRDYFIQEILDDGVDEKEEDEKVLEGIVDNIAEIFQHYCVRYCSDHNFDFNTEDEFVQLNIDTFNLHPKLNLLKYNMLTGELEEKTKAEIQADLKALKEEDEEDHHHHHHHHDDEDDSDTEDIDLDDK